MRLIHIIFVFCMSAVCCHAYPITDDESVSSFWDKLDSVFWTNYKPNPFPLDSVSIDRMKMDCKMKYKTLKKAASVSNISSWSEADRENYLVNKAKWVFLTVASDFYRDYSQPKIVKDSIFNTGQEQEMVCYCVLFPNNPLIDDIIRPSIRTESYLFRIWIPENTDNDGFLYYVGPYETGYDSFGSDNVLNKRFKYVTGKEVGPKVMIDGKPVYWLGIYIPKTFVR